MSLDFDVGKVKNYDVITSIPNPYFDIPDNLEECENLQWHPVTNGLVWATMAIGMNTITQDNWIEFYKRLNAWERVVGGYVRRHGNCCSRSEKDFITPLEVYSHIGLHTNASNKTLKQFQADLYEISCRQSSGLKAEDVEEEYNLSGREHMTKAEWFAKFLKREETKEEVVS